MAVVAVGRALTLRRARSSRHLVEALGRLRPAPWVYSIALAIWASSWNLRLSVLMDWLPLEPVRAGALAVALCVVHRLGRRVSVDRSVWWPLLLLVLAFVPGALRSSDSYYAASKLDAMLFVLLPAVAATVLLLDTVRARGAWAGTQVLVGCAVAVASLTNPATLGQFTGRLALETVNTVSTARFVGAAVVVLVLVGFARSRHLWWAWPIAIACGVVLIRVGSRGPLVFALVSVVAVMVVAPCFARRRLTVLLSAAVFALVGYVYAARSGSSGGQRLISLVRDGLVDSDRRRLMGDALRTSVGHPWGVGWGDFPQYSQTARLLANDQGVGYPHNMFLEALVEGGVVAMLALLLVVLLALVRLWRNADATAGVLAFGAALYWLLNAQVSLDLAGNRIALLCVAGGLAAVGGRSDAVHLGRTVDKAATSPQAGVL